MTSPLSTFPVYNLYDRIEELSKHGCAGFATEYEDLCKIDEDAFINREKEFHSATQTKNVKKNRYMDVLANEKSRIKLSKGETDYINANMIPGSLFDFHVDYIASQGPMDETIPDFFQMIWDYNAPIIVMLAKEVESGRIKCARYWPDKVGQSKKFGSIDVKLESEKALNKEIIHRKLQISDGSKSKSVELLHYIGWPDHGVPKETKNFRCLLSLVDELLKETNTSGPVVVHCSAGIGRTGTFICVHIITRKLKDHLKEKKGKFDYDVFETVKKLKTLRSGMVQTIGQYIFCYKAIYEEAIALGVKF